MRRNKLVLLLPVLLLVLSGCGVNGVDSVIGPDNASGLWDIVVLLFSQGIIFFGELLAHNLIVGLIVMTLVFRIAMIPLYKKQIQSQAEMAVIQPELKVIQNKYKGKKDQDSKIKQNQETQALYKRHKINPLAGCLPMLIQMPLLFAFYDAIQNLLMYGDAALPLYGDSAASLSSIFLGIDMSKPSIIVAVLAAVSTYYSTHVATLGAPKPVKDPSKPSGPDMMTSMKIVMPIMILMMGLQFPAALAVYWLTGNIVTIVQTLVLKRDTIFAAKEKKKLKK